MKKIYSFLFSVMLTTLAYSQTVNLVVDSHEGEAETAPGKMIANSTFMVYAGNGANTWTAARSIAGSIYYYDYTDSEVWVSDGTAPNTRMLEINATFTVATDAEGTEYTQHNSAGFSDQILFNDKAYFNANNGEGFHVYYIDGISGDKVMALENSWARVLPDQANGIVYLTEGSASPWKTWDGVNLSELVVLPNQYEADGTTLKVENSSNGACLLGDKIVFAGSYVDPTLDVIGTELFVYDPAGTDGPQLLKDIRVGTSSSSPKYFVEHNDIVYFMANDGSGTYALWKTDGTSAGTVRVTPGDAEWTVDVNGQPFLFNSKLYFEGDDDNSATDALDQLYEYDPAANTLTRISGLLDAYKASLPAPEEVFINFDPKSFVVLDNTLYFYAKYSFVEGDKTYDSTTNAIYKLNGTSVELVSESVGFYPVELLAFNGKIYFAGEDTELIDNGDGTFTSSGEELFVYDPNGTPTSIEPVRNQNEIDIFPNPSYGHVNVTGFNGETAEYKLYDLSGQLVERGMLNNDIINYNVSKGVYILKVANGTLSKAMKLIVR
ncbi:MULTISPECIES: T9SS type A sorting domain-containing protein [unclassified Carboxylicivirga]|uniref:T9SS type A sorting domain-containing protein n=1 Tax=Carboxylicivirga TaxID=1628153 RepID=UPI003D33381D